MHEQTKEPANTARSSAAKQQLKPDVEPTVEGQGRQRGAQSVALRLQRRCGNRGVQRALDLARSGHGEAEATPEVEESIQRARGGGQPLDGGVRAQMESAFGTDFGGVRTHTGAEADALNRALNARAFTTGGDIFFRGGEYQPGSSSGRELLAHELTHVVQQSGASVRRKLTVNAPGDAYEEEADRVARAVVRMPQAGADASAVTTAGLSSPAPNVAVQRQAAPAAPAAAPSAAPAPPPSRNLSDALAAVQDRYYALLNDQNITLDLFEDDARQTDAPIPPSIVETIIVACITTALTAALGAIAGKIADRLIAQGTDPVTKTANEIVSSYIKDGVQGGVTRLLAESRASAAAREPLSLFVYTQKTYLSERALGARDLFRSEQAARFESMEQQEPGRGIRELDRLRDTLDAERRQQRGPDGELYRHALTQWTVYLAQTQMGAYDPDQPRPNPHEAAGTNLGAIWHWQGARSAAWSPRGVLMITAAADFSQPATPVRIVSARIDGLNEVLRSGLTNRPIRSLGIPVVAGITGLAAGPALFQIGLNEGGTVWYQPWEIHRSISLTYLHHKVHPNENMPALTERVSIASSRIIRGPDEATWQHFEDTKYAGARLVLEREIGPQSLTTVGR